MPTDKKTDAVCLTGQDRAGLFCLSALFREIADCLSAARPPSPKPSLDKRMKLIRQDLRKNVNECAAAVRARKAGQDGVENHSACGCILNRFCSPIANNRTDEYGADTMRDRRRLYTDTIKALRDAVGQGYPIAEGTALGVSG